jgi:hypothetical protein
MVIAQRMGVTAHGWGVTAHQMGQINPGDAARRCGKIVGQNRI